MHSAVYPLLTVIELKFHIVIQVDPDTMEVRWITQEFHLVMEIFINLTVKFKIIKMLMKLGTAIWFL